MRLGLLINEIDTRAGQSQTDLPRFSVSQYRGVIPIGESGVRSAKPKSLEKYKVVHAGDLVLNRFNAYKGALGIAPTKGLVSPDYFTARPISGKAAKYLDYFLRSQQAKEEILLSMSGMGAADPNSSAFSRFDIREVLAIDVPIEDLDTQRRIADYLDTETAQIDAMMAKLDEQVGLLRERRSSLQEKILLGDKASVYVTAWKNELRGNWDSVPAWMLFQNKTKKSSLGDVHLTPSQNFGVVTQKEYMELSESRVVLNLTGADSMKHVDEDDFIIHLRSFQGGIEHSTISGKVSNAYTVMSPTEKVHPPYFARLLKARTFIELLGSQTGQLRDGQSINFARFSKLCLPLPPLDEQRRIVAELDEKTSRIDTMITKCEELKTLLQERRAALITAVVTGQKEVPSHD